MDRVIEVGHDLGKLHRTGGGLLQGQSLVLEHRQSQRVGLHDNTTGALDLFLTEGNGEGRCGLAFGAFDRVPGLQGGDSRRCREFAQPSQEFGGHTLAA